MGVLPYEHTWDLPRWEASYQQECSSAYCSLAVHTRAMPKSKIPKWSCLSSQLFNLHWYCLHKRANTLTSRMYHSTSCIAPRLNGINDYPFPPHGWTRCTDLSQYTPFYCHSRGTNPSAWLTPAFQFLITLNVSQGHRGARPPPDSYALYLIYMNAFSGAQRRLPPNPTPSKQQPPPSPPSPRRSALWETRQQQHPLSQRASPS